MANTWIKDAVFHMALKAIEAKLEGDHARVESLCTMMDIHTWQSGAKDALVKLLRLPERPFANQSRTEDYQLFVT